jgi:spermidine/putrescine transport system ATP-binding protein
MESPMTATAAVQLRDIVKAFGEVIAVDHVSLEIGQGEFFSLLGPSGCGKTTSLRMIAGFEMPTAGQVLIDGEAQGYRPPFKRPVNTVFQHYALFPHMTVFENIAFGLQMQKVDKAEIGRRVSEVVELVHLRGMEKRRPKQLSGGQQQRVALARALVNRPKVLLLDEPLGALDLKLRKQMQVELKALQQEVGITFIYVTHDQEEALTMSDRLAVMDLGCVQQVGGPEEIYERPVNRFVADFIGDTNFVPCRVTSLGPRPEVEIAGGMRVPVSWIREGLSVGSNAVLSVRPEKLNLFELHETYPSGEHSAAVQGRVEHLVYVGTDTHHTIRLPDGTTLVARVQNFYVDEEPWEVGEAVVIQWDSAHARVFKE